MHVALTAYAIKAVGNSIVQDISMSPSHFNLSKIYLKSRVFRQYFYRFRRLFGLKKLPLG